MASKAFVVSIFAMMVGRSLAAKIPFGDLSDSLQDPILTIVGGQTATEGQFPWQLRLLKDGIFICGAVLISPSRALTAAHCVHSGTYTAVAGEHDSTVSSGHEVTRTVATWTKHPHFTTGDGYPNDIAILRFSNSFPSTSYIRTIIMTSSTSPDFTGVTCSISGWGRLGGSASTSTTLQHVSMPVISNSECTSRWAGIEGASINNGHVCIYKYGKSACSGDSGGPLVCDGQLVGLTSWGIRSCSGSYPSVFARISYFRDWINENL